VRAALLILRKDLEDVLVGQQVVGTRLVETSILQLASDLLKSTTTVRLIETSM
jgi:hypothetical protein